MELGSQSSAGRTWRGALAVGVAAFLAAAPAWAQAPDPAAADALFRAGREAANAGDYATACPKFRESLRLDPAPGTLLNVASCEEKLGQLADAWEHYRRLLERLPKGDERAPIARRAAAALEPRVPRVTIELAGEPPPGTKIFRDDIELGSAALGVPLPVNPGAHVILVVAPGRADSRSSITLGEGAQERVEVRAGEPLPGKLPESAEGHAQNGSRPKRTVGFVVTGLGAASLVAGAVTGAMALGKAGTLNDARHCDKSLACDQAGLDAASAGKTLSVVSTVTFAVGAVGLGAGAFLIVTSGGGGAASTTAAYASPLPGGAGLGVARSF